MDVHGDPDKAGFVQVMQGRVSDLERARELMAQNPGERSAFRPDVIGHVAAGHEGGACTLAFISPPNRRHATVNAKSSPLN